MKWAYYNEIEPHAAEWIRQLIKANLIPDGEVDTRSICDVRPDDVRGFLQQHYFAGISGWAYALQLAGFPEDRAVWTGSCPCQPYSAAGKGLGDADSRNLWPAFFRLIKECRPQLVFGEQVASAIGHGWLDGISADLEEEDYACGAVVLGAHSVGAPHIRPRLYWMANTQNHRTPKHLRAGESYLERSGADGRMADAATERHEGGDGGESASGRWPRPGTQTLRHSSSVGLVNANGSAQERLGSVSLPLEPQQEAGRPGHEDAWSDFELIQCSDGKARRTQPGLFPLAHGVSGRVAKLRGLGNAIVPQVAKEFILACLAEIDG